MPTGIQCTVIGEVMEDGDRGPSDRVMLETRRGVRRPLEKKGYEHLVFRR